MQLFKKQISSEDIGMDDIMANIFWKRTYLIIIFTKFVVYLCIIGGTLICFIMLCIRWPREWIINGIVAVIHFSIWLYYSVPNMCMITFIFHIICFYFKLRFHKINKKIKNLLNENEGNDRIIDLLKSYTISVHFYMSIISFGNTLF